MLTFSPENSTPVQHIESFGRLNGSGPEVTGSVVVPEGGESKEDFAIIAGCGATVEDYFDLQLHLAELKIGSVAVNPLYVAAGHANQIQAMAVEHGIEVASEMHGIRPTNYYGHSWGAAKMASLLSFGIDGAEMAVSHNGSGFESAIGNLIRNPLRTIRHAHREFGQVAKHAVTRQRLNPVQRAVLFGQHIPVASQHRKAERHFGNVKSRGGIFLVGLFAETDLFFNAQQHGVFHHNEVLAGSVHTETQIRPERVAQKLVDLIKLKKVFQASAQEERDHEPVLRIAAAGS